MMREMLRSFVDKEIMPVRQQIDDDKDHKIVNRILQGLTDLGTQKSAFPPEYGGMGASSVVSAAVLHEELGRGDSGICTARTVTGWAWMPALVANNKAVMDRFAPEFSGQVCSAGQCSTSCAPGLTQCGTSCVDSVTNPLHCGACDNACPAGQACTGGLCQCPAGQTSCDGQCVDTNTNPAHCGNCTTACAAGQACSAGICGCAADQQLCAGQCVDTLNSVLHCGGCDQACVGGQSCVNGACACPSGQQLCDGSCADTESDPY